MNLKKSAVPLAIASLFAGLIAGCNDSNNTAEKTIDQEITALISSAGLKGDPIESLGGMPGAPVIPKVAGNADAALQAKVDLGKLLFFSKEMSFEKEVACVTCHHPVLGGGDNVALPIGVNPVDANLFGPGRLRAATATVPPYTSNGVAGNPAMPRNSPTVFGLAFWDKSITWDGTVTSEKGSKGMAGIDSQIVAPIDTAPVIYSPLLASIVGTRFDLLSKTPIPYADKFDAGMLVSAGHGLFPASVKPAMRSSGFADGTCTSGAVVDGVTVSCVSGTGNFTDLDIRRIMANRFNTPAWASYFTAAFGDALATPSRISTAIAFYERSQTFTQSSWRSYVKGNTAALSESQKRGALLFFKSKDQGGAECASCHSGDFFTDEENYVLAIPQIGRGKGDANSATDNNDDWGRAHVTGVDTDKYAYRVPTLLNVEVTGPYTHNGVHETLEETIRHHLNPAAGVAAFKASVDSGALATRLQTLYGPSIDMTRAKEHTDMALARLQAQRAAGLETIKDISLTDAQVADLVEFMKALTDPCTKDKSCLAKWVPQSTDTTQATAIALNLICPKDSTGANMIATQRCQ